MRPQRLDGTPSQRTYEWVDPRTGEPGPAGEATGPGGASGEQGAIERAPIPEDYRDHVGNYFAPGGRQPASPRSGQQPPSATEHP